jgi:hypothetical protein
LRSLLQLSDYHMKKRFFIKSTIALSFLSPAILLNLSFAQEGKESKVRRTGSTRSIKLLDLRAVERNGLLTVQATFQNDSMSGTPINYRFKWLDDAKMRATSNDESWKPMNLFAGQTVDIIGVAPTPMATDFIIELNGSN